MTAAAAPVPSVEFRGLTKDFAIGLRGLRLRAVDQLSLRIDAGQIYGLLGPNGSGKSTTIKILLGLLTPTAGDCAIFGVSAKRVETRSVIGYLPESPDFHRHLTGRELVAFHGRLCGLSGGKLTRQVDAAIARVGLVAAAGRRVGTYSKGMLQRIGLAQALVHEPRLLVLDEPTAGVDPLATEEMTKLILELKAEGRTLLITSHLLSHMEEICDRVAILDCGRLVVEGTVEELTGAAGREALIVDQLSAPERTALQAWLSARGHRVETAEIPRFSLDQLFRERVGRGR